MKIGKHVKKFLTKNYVHVPLHEDITLKLYLHVETQDSYYFHFRIRSRGSGFYFTVTLYGLQEVLHSFLINSLLSSSPLTQFKTNEHRLSQKFNFFTV